CPLNAAPFHQAVPLFVVVDLCQVARPPLHTPVHESWPAGLSELPTASVAPP
ncbi:hypothetical protein M9458_026900, partial [Cirrhinus mrigala]